MRWLKSDRIVILSWWARLYTNKRSQYLLKGESAMKRMKERFIWVTYRILIILGPIVATYGDVVTPLSKWDGG